MKREDAGTNATGLAAPTAPQSPPAEGRAASSRLQPAVRVINGLSIALAVPAALAAVALMLQVIVDVTGRTLFNHPMKGTLEVTQHWWMMAIVFGSLAYAEYRREHIRATIIVDLLPFNWRRAAEIATTVLLAALALLITYYGWSAAQHSHEVREATNGSPPIPIWPFVYAVPAGAFAMFLQCLATICQVASSNDTGAVDPLADDSGLVL